MLEGQAAEETPAEDYAPSHITGLDEILGGGFRRGAVHVIEGEAGTGKTTIALLFARAGASAGERVLYFSFAETLPELHEIARSHGWSMDDVEFRYLNVQEELSGGSPQTMLEPSELYLPRISRQIREAMEEIRPQRLIVDSLSDLRLVSHDLWLFRSQLMQLRDMFVKDGCTTLLLDGMTEYSQHLRTLASGIITLEQDVVEFGPVRRRLNVIKMRARSFQTGLHDFRIVKGGLRVYPRLAAREEVVRSPDILPSGLDNLDKLVGGGLDRGTSVLLLGPAGVGKSLLATQYAAAATRRGEKVTFYLFDERRQTFVHRARSLGLDINGASEKSLLRLRRIDPGEMSPGEFAWTVRQDVQQEGCSMVVIDSLSGYLHAMPEQRFLTLHLHELLTFLGQDGIVTLLVLTEHGPFTGKVRGSIDLSYLTDSVLLFRYFEYDGEMRRALSIYKRRSGDHERLIREIRVGPNGVQVGKPLRGFRGILSGRPQYTREDMEGAGS